MIKEELLHFLWRTHKFPKIGMQTTAGEYVEILSPGILNHGDGPDFSNAKIRIGDVLWVGPVELHLKSSDWYAHQHHHDKRYDPVILHVVLEENQPIQVLNRRLPCIEIKKFVKPDLIARYKDLQVCKENLACAPYPIENIAESFLWMRDRLLTERLQRRLTEVNKLVVGRQALFYKLLLGALGAKANRVSFMDFANRIHWSQVNRWQNRPERIYSYFMYLSGLFEKEVNLMPEKSLLAAYVANPMNKLLWQTRSIRPASQPKRRILEFCALVVHDTFTTMLEADDPFFYNDAWNTTIQSLRSGVIDQVTFSEFVLRNIALNAVVPFAFYRGVQSGDPAWFDFALQHVEEWPPEQNKIIKLYQNKSLKIKSGGDSQALLELYNQYCIPKKCVSCAIGTTLLRA
jgi:hypothetical protein